MQTLVVTLTGSAQKLETSSTKWLAEVSLQPDGANANPIFVGSANTVSSSVYGVRLPAADAGEPPPPWNLEIDPNGPRVSLDDIWVIGNNGEKLHVVAVYGKTRNKVE